VRRHLHLAIVNGESDRLQSLLDSGAEMNSTLYINLAGTARNERESVLSEAPEEEEEAIEDDCESTVDGRSRDNSIIFEGDETESLSPQMSQITRRKQLKPLKGRQKPTYTMDSSTGEKRRTLSTESTTQTPKRQRSFKLLSKKWSMRTKSLPAYQNINTPHVRSNTASERRYSSDEEEDDVNNNSDSIFQSIKDGMDMTLQTLLEAGDCDHEFLMHYTNEGGLTACMQAAWHGQLVCLQILLRHGADPFSRNTSGCSAIHFAAGQGHTDCVTALLDWGEDVNRATVYGATAAILASKGGHADCLSLLIDRGANLSKEYRNGKNALNFAVGNGHYDCLKLLLENGMDAKRYNEFGFTPLMRAAQQGYNPCIVLLLDFGADAGKQDVNGRTALHYAVEMDDLVKTAKLLLRHEPNLLYKETKRGSTPLDYAERYGNFKCQELFQSHLNKLKRIEEQNEKRRERTVSCIPFISLRHKKSHKFDI